LGLAFQKAISLWRLRSTASPEKTPSHPPPPNTYGPHQAASGKDLDMAKKNVPFPPIPARPTPASPLLEDIQWHIMSTLGNDYHPPRKFYYYKGLSYSMRDRLIRRWIETQRSIYERVSKRVYYLSMEFLPGRFLMNYIVNMGMTEESQEAMKETGFSLAELAEQEWDAGLGNGGLGRLASCYLDAMATLKIPGYGYGIRYDYGIFFQKIVNGYQVERADNWLRYGSPWEIYRRRHLYEVKFYGRSVPVTDENGRLSYQWTDTANIMAMACDILIPGYANDHVMNMRLWVAMSSRDFDLTDFNQGDYMGAMEAKVMSENISKVLYPSDELEQGRELRLKQQYFFVAATFQDILRRFKKKHTHFSEFPNLVAVQLNDTHPSIGIPELMRLLMDEEGFGWDEAWPICQQTFAYTNHTVLPEALESWPVGLLSHVLPRHLEIIYEINRRFLEAVAQRYPGDTGKLDRLSIVHAGQVRMAHLAIVGSHTVNGVAALHTRILKETLFREFDELFPGRIINVTNGITPRRWLLQTNPELSALITAKIGPGWVGDLDRLRELLPLAEDLDFQAAWRMIKHHNKERLALEIQRLTCEAADPDSLFDVQIKRIHEYKRQLLNLLHVITLYHRLRQDPKLDRVPRTVIFAGKAAPGYALAKLIIKLINAVAATVNADPLVSRRLKVVFLPNYSVSLAEKIVPGADLSEQISTAGMEASGTGNMKFALNGALTIGTLDGATVEIREEVGSDNIFIFGLTSEEVNHHRKAGHNPWHYYHADPELKQALDAIRLGHFAPEAPALFAPVWKALMEEGDRYLVLADFRAYLDAQEKVEQCFRDPAEWTRRSIFNTANMGKFSSDRSVREYAEKIWKIKPLKG
jgi:starch phosphorylase